MVLHQFLKDFEGIVFWRPQKAYLIVGGTMFDDVGQRSAMLDDVGSNGEGPMGGRARRIP